MVSLSVPAARVHAEAARLQSARVLLWLLAAPFLLLGWTARAVWFVLALAIAAVKVGWESGPAPKPSPVRGARR